MSGRCKVVIETLDGEFTRCQQMLYHEDDEFCYYHKKVMQDLCEPSDRDYYDPMRVVAYHLPRGGKLKGFDNYITD